MQNNSSIPTVENQIEGELDYAKGGFELVQWQKGGDEITLGKIDESSEIHLDLPEYDIRALGRNHFPSNIESQFNMIGCKGKGPYGLTGEPVNKTPYADVYSQMYPQLFVKKYGTSIGYLAMVSDEKMLIKGNFNKVIGNKYYLMYIDRDLDFKDTCIREPSGDKQIETEWTADVQFKKGWNFIKSSIVEVHRYGENNEQTQLKKMVFTASSAGSKDVKWVLKRRMDDEKIQAAKIKFESQL